MKPLYTGLRSETPKNEPPGEPQELPTRDPRQHEKLQNCPNARRWTPLTRAEKRQRAINRGDAYWTPGCGRILPVSQH